MNMRNSPCACGSGKKYKHCCLGKKPRTRTVTVDMGRVVKVNAIKFDPVTRDIKFFNDGEELLPTSSKVGLSYPRKKGDKVLNEVSFAGPQVIVDPNRALGNYDVLVAVDTNTRTIGEEVVSMTGMVTGRHIAGYAPGKTAVRFGTKQCFEFWGAREQQERIGWSEVLRAMLRSSAFPHAQRIGMIVDAYLGALAKINAGEEAVYGDMYLPKNVTLLYASTDTPNDGIANKMLSLADMQSRELLNHVIRDKPQENLQPAEGKPFSHHRVWQRKDAATSPVT